MNLLVAVPSPLFWLSLIAMVGVLLGCVTTAPWRKLMAVGIRQHLWFGGIVLMGVAWAYLGVTVKDVLRLHPILMTTITLVFGFRLGILQATAALILTTALQGYSWQAVPFAWCCSILLPACATETLLRLVTFIRVQNLFLYTLGVGFVGGILTSVLIGGSTLFGLWVTNAYYFDEIWEAAYLFFMFVFPEGFCNGYIVSSLAVMAPHLVKTYDDDFFLRR